MEDNNANNVPQKATEQSSLGPTVGSIIVIIVVIIGGIYFWWNKINTERESAKMESQTIDASSEAEFVENEAELKKLDIQDEELNKLEQDIQGL
ncbi:MAG: hypothetical protein AAB688_01335 [Patescibacteria group bacterium]